MVQRKFSNTTNFELQDRAVFLAVLIVVAGTWGFVALADKMVEGRVETFDEWGIRSLRRPEDAAVLIGPRWVAEAVRHVTDLGGESVLIYVNLAVAGGFVVRRKFNALAYVVAAVVGGLLLMLLLKECFARPRPQVVPYLCAVTGSSFPSGHSMMSAVVYLTLGILLASGIARWRFKLVLLALALLLAGLVGVSRVCLGVHYPTDVLAGWTAGLVWATFCWLLARKLKRRTGEATRVLNIETE
ncbi:MAG: phosphatase PAP2 family protein [Thermoguttaceae bacterium]|jgi:undecaprenyl-diphosphatase